MSCMDRRASCRGTWRQAATKSGSFTGQSPVLFCVSCRCLNLLHSPSPCSLSRSLLSIQAACLRGMTVLIKRCVSVYWIDTEGADLVWPIVQQGMNERFAGASAGTAFGDVSVFCTPPCFRSCECVCAVCGVCVCIAICTIPGRICTIP